MGATKKRRNTKHRGNAAGMVETRGNTGAGRGAAPSGAAGRGAPRVPQPANWNSAMLKGLIPVALLAVVFIGFGKHQTVPGIVIKLVLAYALYTPIVYATDRFMYQRYLKRGR